MRKKGSLLIILTILLLAILSGSYAYSKYASAAVGIADTNQASWDIKVNGCNIVHPEKNSEEIKKKCFKVTEPDEFGTIRIERNYQPSELTYDKGINDYGTDGTIADGKIAPGSEATFTIEIDPRETEVAFEYAITTTFDNNNIGGKINNNIVLYILDPNDSQYKVLNKDTEAIKKIIEYKENRGTEDIVKIDFKLEWKEDLSTDNDINDTIIGTDIEKISIPITIDFKQILSLS